MDDIKAECMSDGQVHVKEEEDNIKEELEWEGGAGLGGTSAAAARAGLYAGHEVKDELVLGPERVQPPDIAFTRHAYQALAARAQPALRECVARPETHVAHNADVGNQVHSNANIHKEKETYVCGVCNKRFALKTCLVENLMIHIHQEPEQEEIRVADNDHIDRIHADQKRFCCDICQKRFAQKTTLVGHILRHMAVWRFTWLAFATSSSSPLS